MRHHIITHVYKISSHYDKSELDLFSLGQVSGIELCVTNFSQRSMGIQTKFVLNVLFHVFGIAGSGQ